MLFRVFVEKDWFLTLFYNLNTEDGLRMLFDQCSVKARTIVESPDMLYFMQASAIDYIWKIKPYVFRWFTNIFAGF